MIKRLRVKFVCINMVLLMAMLMVIFGLVYYFTAESLESDSISTLKTAVSTQIRPGRPGATTQPYFTLELNPWGSLTVVGSDYFDLTDTEMLLDIYEEAQEQQTRFGILEEYDLRFYRAEEIVKFAFVDISAERTTLHNLVENFVIIGIAGFMGFLGISILLALWAVRPVEIAWKQQRQFVADASHELKTPLTVILTNAELLQSQEHTPEEKGRFAESILTMTRQMRGLVESLLQLARVDNGRATAECVRLDLSAVAEESVLPFEPVYFEQGLTLESRVDPGIFVKGNPQYLRQVLDILLDNGQKYSAPGSTVSLELTRQGRKAMLRFFSPGQPMSKEQCRYIFKRFYRADEARAMSGSYGLGLSIAQRIVTEHGGRIWAQSQPEGNTFFVTLPEGGRVSFDGAVGRGLGPALRQTRHWN